VRPPGVDPRELNLYELGPAPIAGKAGDLIIWHQALPHGSSPNSAARPRVAQYLSMRPSQWEYRDTWK
jgi:ectoine hydroxylase-related dioxygenase (phytanoyl-CoA dioxygenase family)